MYHPEIYIIILLIEFLWRQRSKSSHRDPGLKLPQKSREKSLLPPAGLGRSEILAGRSEILAVAETHRKLPRQLLLYCLYFSPIYIQENLS